MFKIIKKLFLIYVKFLSVNIPYEELGTPYGGWQFIPLDKNEQLNVISAGVGEDISFDIELINKYQCSVVLVDPTPRAITHYKQVKKRFGKQSTKEYNLSTGKQDSDSYDLNSINENNLKFVDKAITNKSNKSVKFYPPINNEFVSYSISNFQMDFKKTEEFITVLTTRIMDIVNEFDIKHIALLKLDIEGAENLVIPDILKNNIFPDQILVEFDELRTTFIRPYIRAFIIFTKLKFNNYKLVNTNKFPNFLFVRI